MKIRNGFVSNSSSSSFILASKTALTKEQVSRAMGIPKDSLIAGIGDEVAQVVIDSANKVSTWKAYVDEAYDGNEAWVDKSSEKIKELLEKGWDVYCGEFSNSSNNILEMYLCDVDLNYISDNLIIIHKGFG